MEEIITKLEAIIVRENTKLKEELRQEFKTDNAKLKEELRAEFKAENEKLKEELKEEFDKKMIDRMFVFETEYGRKINILFEEIMAQNKKDRNTEENIVILERRVDDNSAFVFNHENRITALEQAKG